MTYVETNCTFTHQGHTFEAGGAAYDDDRIVAYVQSGDAIEMIGAAHTVTTWHGEPIGHAIITGKWRIRSWQSSHMFSYRVRLWADGREYNARGMGKGMVLTGKRSRQAYR